ncbi:hypothetical protein JTB14_020773 [Gonioctena quinquepunctata]|nr:hypothetical protein JTB14_020773 [Gonioctena quinquepunctata]
MVYPRDPHLAGHYSQLSGFHYKFRRYKMNTKKYKKKTGASGAKGTDYQVKVLALFALEGAPLDNWKLSTENEEAGNFEDIVIQSDGDFLIQCKHSTSKQFLFSKDFWSTNTKSDFGLPKYFSSFVNIRNKFKNIKLLIFCTNIDLSADEDIFEEESPSLDLFKRVKKSYKFNVSYITQLENITKDNDVVLLKEFCEKIRLFRIDDKELDGNIDESLNALRGIFGKTFYKEPFIERIREWFYSEKGYFIEKPHVAAFLHDTRSQKYFESLENYNISFRKSYSIHNNGIINVVVKNQLLSILHIHDKLRAEFKEGKVLYRDPEDDLEHVVDAFELPIYKILLVSLSPKDVAQKDSFLGSVDKILKQRTYKKAIILSNDPIIEKDGNEVKIEQKTMNFEEFSKEFQDMLLSKTLIFQGENIPLRNLIDNTNGPMTSIIDEETIVKLINGEKMKIGKPIRKLGELEHLYITRTFTKDGKIFSEEDFYQANLERTLKFNLIADGAGMGKTTILTRLGSLIKQQFPQCYLIRIDLNLYTRLFKACLVAKNKSLNLEDFVQTDDEDLLNTTFKENVFKIPNKIVLMVDAVDEVSPNFTELIMTFLLETSRRSNIVTIFVTTRSHQKQDLENKLRVKSFKLHPFSNLDQVTFLTKFWKSGLSLDGHEKEKKCEIYAKKLLNEIDYAIGEELLDLVGIPLQTMMIADIFQSSEEKRYWMSCQDFLTSGSDDLVGMPKELNIVMLYDMFVNKKRNIYVNDKGNTQGNVFAEEALSEQFGTAIIEHQKLAAELLLDTKYCQLLKVTKYPSISKHIIIRMGIIKKTGDKLSFIHQTFAEYFLAKCLWNQLKETQEKDEFLHFLVEEIFISPGFGVVRSFFNNILKDKWKQILEDTFVSCGKVVESITWNESKNLVQLAEEDCFYILKLILTTLDVECQEKNPLNIVVVERLILYGLKKRVELESVIVSGIRPIHYAAHSGSLECLRLLIDKGADVNATTSADRRPIHDAALFGRMECLQLLVEKGADVNAATSARHTPIHEAARSGSVECLHILS